MRRFVVTGCSRSGTKYMSRLLSELGFVCGHERVFNIHRVFDRKRTLDHFDGAAEGQGDSSFLTVPFVRMLPRGTLVLHQVRHPMAVIRSHMGIRFFAEPLHPSIYLADNHSDFLAFVRRYCPDVFEAEDEISRCMRYWTHWNRMAEEAARIEGLHYLRYQVEALDRSLLQTIVRLLGGSHSEETLEAALASVSTSTNARLRDETVSWEALPKGKAKKEAEELAAMYGYSVPNTIMDGHSRRGDSPIALEEATSRFNSGIEWGEER